MWKSIKIIKKSIIIQLNDVKNKVIDLSLLTYGLIWKNTKCILGNTRLKTNKEENIIYLSYLPSQTSSIIYLNIYNLIYQSSEKQLLIFKKFKDGVTSEAKSGITIDTQFHVLQFFGSISWYDWLGMNGREDGIPVGFTIDIYSVSDSGTEINIYSIPIKEFEDWISLSMHTDSGMDDGSYDIYGVQSFSKVIILPTNYTFNKLKIKVNKGYAIDKDSDMYLFIKYIDTTKQPERTATDIHLIAWEES